MREFLSKMFRVFLIAHLCISINVAIVGHLLEPDAQLTYLSFWGPVVMAALCILPSLILYSRHKLSIKEVIFRRALQVLFIEAIVLIGLYIVAPMREVGAVVTVGVSVLIVYGVICLIDWAQGKMDADAMNRKLLELKKER